MDCRDVLHMADSFISDELQNETSHQIQRHLEACPSCGVEIEARRRLRIALRVAFERAPELQPTPGLSARVRQRLDRASLDDRRRAPIPGLWLVLATAATIFIAVAGAFYMRPVGTPADTLVRDAIGDHRNCALTFRLPRSPVPLADAAQRFDRAYKLLLEFPPDRITTPDGRASVIERHSCAYGGRRFAHIVLRYRSSVVSLLVTSDDSRSGSGAPPEAAPHLHEPSIGGLSVVSVHATRHVILLVGDLPPASLTQLADAVSVPLSQQLQLVRSDSARENIARAPALRVRD